MFRIDRAGNKLQTIEERTFSGLGFQERRNLQEWIVAQPSIFGEDLLILQKEFDGFADTHERLDLLALDTDGNLVLIENKLDDTGRDVMWQALKYASYCSTLTRDQIRSIYQAYLDRYEAGTYAETKLCSFLGVGSLAEAKINSGSVTQRVILVAASFRKEVTSTVLWLMNFGLQIQCFKVTPYADGEDLFLGVDQIIPTPDAQDYVIGLGAKMQEEAGAAAVERHRHKIRREFWTLVLQKVNQRTDQFVNVGPGPKAWLGASAGADFDFTFGATQKYGRVELYIDSGQRDTNLWYYDQLRSQQADIERAFGEPLTWEPLEGARACRIKWERPADVFDRDQWPELADELVAKMLAFMTALKPRLGPLANALKSSTRSK